MPARIFGAAFVENIIYVCVFLFLFLFIYFFFYSSWAEPEQLEQFLGMATKCLDLFLALSNEHTQSQR